MRISAGKYRGKNLFSPASLKVRPTSDRTREAVFNILRSRLGGRFPQLTFFDIFAGSGAMGLEALSQGFGKVCFFEMETQDLLKNVKLFPNEQAVINIIKGDFLRATPSLQADVVFMDAPYKQDLSHKALAHLAEQKALKKGAICLVEIEKSETVDLPPCYQLLDERKYGLAKLLILEFLA